MPKVGASLTLIDSLPLEPFELGHSPRDAQIRSPFLAVAGEVRQGEVVLVVRAFFGSGDDVVNVKLTFVKDQIDEPIANETATGLPIQEPLLQRLSCRDIQ
ncbi:MAG: hypothetical protein ABIP48_19450 [Planctomycetota bacterium]